MLTDKLARTSGCFYFDSLENIIAIKKAISIAKKGDTVVIAGIGHQKYRGGPDGKEKWDEYEVTRSAIHRTDDPFTDSWRGIMHKYYPDSY